MLWAAGIGITHQLPHVRDIVAAYGNGTTATRRLTLVWIIQSPEHLEWIRAWMTQILAMPRRREILKILLFVTRPRNNKEIHSPSSSVQMMPGRPNIQSLIDQEMQDGIGAACVSTCGTGSLADEIRSAVRARPGAVERGLARRIIFMVNFPSPLSPLVGRCHHVFSSWYTQLSAYASFFNAWPVHALQSHLYDTAAIARSIEDFSRCLLHCTHYFFTSLYAMSW